MGLVWYGLVLVGQGNFREAGQRNREALQRDPLSPIINVNVGFDALRYGDVAQAKTSFAAAIDIDPYFPVSHYGLARAHAQAKEFDPALHAIDAAIALAPERAYYHARKGLLLLQADQHEAAGRSVEEACCKAPDNPFDADLITDDWIWRLPHVINRAHLWLLAKDARGRDELEGLLRGFDHMTQQEIVNPVASYWAACAHALLGHSQQARALLEEARRIGWHHPWWERQGWNIRALGEPSVS